MTVIFIATLISIIIFLMLSIAIASAASWMPGMNDPYEPDAREGSGDSEASEYRYDPARLLFLDGWRG